MNTGLQAGDVILAINQHKFAVGTTCVIDEPSIVGLTFPEVKEVFATTELVAEFTYVPSDSYSAILNKVSDRSCCCC